MTIMLEQPAAIAVAELRDSAMTLHIDYAAERTYARMVGGLRSARVAAGLSQNEVAVGLPVRGRAISEWECGGIQPKLPNLIGWSERLDHRLAVLSHAGELLPGPTRPRPGES